MLESVEIKNFRSCEDVQFRLGDPVVALLGKNGAGKTNVLHAIQLVAEQCVGGTDSAFGLSPRERSQPTRFSLQFSIEASLYDYRIARTTPAKEKEPLEERLERDGLVLFSRNGETLDAPAADFPASLRVGMRTSSLEALLQLLPQDHPLHSDLDPVVKYLSAVQYYTLTQSFLEHVEGEMPPFIEAAAYAKWKSQLAQARPAKSVLMRLLHMHLVAKDKLDELKALLGEDGLGLIADILVEEVKLSRRAGKSEETAEPAYAIRFTPCAGLAGAGRPFRFRGLSAGTIRVLQLLTYLIFDESSCMLIEQPEDCIHAGLLAKVIDILRTYSHRTQLICTTHSARVMNLVGAGGIRLVTADGGCTAVTELSPAEIGASINYLKDEGTLSEFLDTL